MFLNPLYKIHLMIADDILRDPSSNTLGIPIEKGMEILSFIDGVAETKNEEVVNFVKNGFPSRMLVKEEDGAIKETIVQIDSGSITSLSSSDENIEVKTMLISDVETIDPDFSVSTHILDNFKSKSEEKRVEIMKASDEKINLKPAVIKDAKTLKSKRKPRNSKKK